ncbi:D-glycero-beta-D-manno-heptose 1,7-bisphosphate 7-phosphatase [Nitrosomonas eutropha]|uniref:D,D-heptose 1,7-bisphosphate phosphatase n=2 Tax=Nitrosomonas eutropha TaxID=916 RepID=A0ABX5M549_9PROT|nr:D-glycero-beta-D-manno-heptose 1,7-bisphosphate 7-phosphatase [Nitrosomonas eutropha]ABI60099.1 D-alpha,beta-D-heptose 1,7-bisphosphate phosphatase [Nitrosomonas eutropha C91]PXV76320.1 D-alpha,beta-D-heptose 1,7-bisphosphate phosphatase [Nitrosomonas eutropha]SCX28701.1 D-alpha,beta-D-heptose 1,7-bisphosphate phosphatase [Nitrosomonas eutropha]
MKLIILDQNGVINQRGDTLIKTPDEWKPMTGSLQAIARLTHAGYRVVTATNQSGIGRGLLNMTSFNAINDKMFRAVQQEGGRLDALFFCPHTQHDKCVCRKPGIGMFKEIRQRYSVELSHVPVVGDSLRDLQAAAKAGAVPVLVLTGKGQATLANDDLPVGTQIYPDLSAVVDSLEIQAL